MADDDIFVGEDIEYETREVRQDVGWYDSSPFFVASKNDESPDGFYGSYNSVTDNLANSKKQFIEIFHIPTQKNVFFKSFLTAFQDNFSTEYTKESVFGRMDPIATYKRTGRQITLGWDVPSSGLSEAKENLAKMNRLIQFLYPVYDPGNGGATTMRSGPIFKIKMGNLIIRPGFTQPGGGVDASAKDGGLPGIIEGFSYAPKLEYGVYDPGKLSGGKDVQIANAKHWSSTDKTSDATVSYDGALYPKVVSAQIQFTVLHDTPLGWEMEGDVAKLRGNPEHGGPGSRFPYGGDNAPFDPATGKRVAPYVEQADWQSWLDLEKDLILRRIDVRANKLLQPSRDVKQFFGG